MLALVLVSLGLAKVTKKISAIVFVTTTWLAFHWITDSVAGLLPPGRPLIDTAPYCAPHHSATMQALVGALLFSGLALLWSFIELLRADRRGRQRCHKPPC